MRYKNCNYTKIGRSGVRMTNTFLISKIFSAGIISAYIQYEIYLLSYHLLVYVRFN